MFERKNLGRDEKVEKKKRTDLLSNQFDKFSFLTNQQQYSWSARKLDSRQ